MILNTISEWLLIELFLQVESTPPPPLSQQPKSKAERRTSWGLNLGAFSPPRSEGPPRDPREKREGPPRDTIGTGANLGTPHTPTFPEPSRAPLFGSASQAPQPSPVPPPAALRVATN